MSKVDKTILRFLLFLVPVIILAFAIVFQIVKLKLIPGDEYNTKIANAQESTYIIEATRGEIVAVDGRKLACSVPSYRIFMDTNAGGLTNALFDENIDALSRRLSAFFGDYSAAEYKNRIRKARMKGNRYFEISKKSVSYTDLKRIKEFPIFNLGSNKGGFIFEQKDTRILPFGSLAARTIGKLYTDREMGAMLGLEQAYDNELRGEPGKGNKIRLSSRSIHNELVAPEDGVSLVSTIDIDIQDVAEHSLRNQLRKHNAHHGVAILMEVKTGAVRAIVNLHRDGYGRYVEDYFNYAIGEAGEPGSTFKLASIIAALEDDLIDINDTINTFSGAYRYYDRTMRDSKNGGYGVVTVKEGFEKSSNIAISRIIQQGYAKKPGQFISRLHDMGLGDELNIDIKGEGKPHIKTPQDKTWSGTTLPWMSIGYEVMITPLQMLTLYNAIANNGRMMKPRFAEGLMEHGAMIKRFGPEVIKSSICSGSTVKKVQELLKGVVEDGTAQNIKGTPYGIAGKTGTAQIADKNSGYKTKSGINYLASFAGYFPADKPIYSCIVVVTGPSNYGYYGNVVAGTVVKDIADKVYANSYNNPDFAISYDVPDSQYMPWSKGGRKKDIVQVFKHLNIPADAKKINSEWVSASSGEKQVDLNSKFYPEGIVPSVIGMGARDAVFLLDEAGLSVRVTGVGRVVEQSLQAGSSYNKGAYIYLKLG